MPDVEGGDLGASEGARKRDSAIAAIILGLWTAFSVTGYALDYGLTIPLS